VKPKKKAKREPSPEDEDEAEPQAEPAASRKAAAGQSGDELVDEDGRPYFLVSDKKRVTLSEFKGKQYVNIREVSPKVEFDTKRKTHRLILPY
jgi:hypothetical protein